MRLVVILFWSLILVAVYASAQQSQTPCEEVRSILATNAADLATQVRTATRENEVLKAKLAEMEKKLKDGEKPVETK